MERVILKVTKKDKGLRLDQFIIKNLELTISRSQIQRLINGGKITLNEKPTKAHYKIKQNDTLLINIPQAQDAAQILPERIPLEVIFEDEDLLVINKPAGMVTHPAQGHYSRTLVNALLNYGCRLSTINGPLRPGIVHRLDKDTSGLLVIAKDDFAHQNLAQQFRRRTVKRKYTAIVKGKVAHNEGLIELPIARDARNRQKMAVSFQKKARYALTRYRVLERYKELTLLELSPHTGRTHQLRVHLKFLGHPILGDSRYGGVHRRHCGRCSAHGRRKKFSHMALHATLLGFCHPRSGEFVEFQSECPEYFKNFLNSQK